MDEKMDEKMEENGSTHTHTVEPPLDIDAIEARAAASNVGSVSREARETFRDCALGDVLALVAEVRRLRARASATVACPACDGRGKVLLGREVEDGCDECGASGRVDAVAEVARLRERVKHYQMQATHHAIVDMDAREAAKRELDHLRAAVRALAGRDLLAFGCVSPDAMRAVMARRGWERTGLGAHHLEGYRSPGGHPHVLAYVPTLATSPFGYRADVARWCEAVARDQCDATPAEVLAEALMEPARGPDSSAGTVTPHPSTPR